MSTPYQKIPGPFWRDPETNRLTEKWSSPALEATAEIDWIFTEKVDGTNVRVIWDGHRVSFAGRTDAAMFPPDLLAYLQGKFGTEEAETLFEQQFGENTAVLYGEGYGAGIQKGGVYRPDKAFVLFDVRVGDWWLLRDAVEEVGRNLAVEVVPVMWGGPCTLVEAIERMRTHSVRSRWGEFAAEGVVGVTVAGLRGRDGQRLIVKLKGRDLAPKGDH